MFSFTCVPYGIRYISEYYVKRFCLIQIYSHSHCSSSTLTFLYTLTQWSEKQTNKKAYAESKRLNTRIDQVCISFSWTLRAFILEGCDWIRVVTEAVWAPQRHDAYCISHSFSGRARQRKFHYPTIKNRIDFIWIVSNTFIVWIMRLTEINPDAQALELLIPASPVLC